MGRGNRAFTPAKADSKTKGVRTSTGSDQNRPHDLYVDDNVYADVYTTDKIRIKQAIASGIEAVFIILGESDLLQPQDPIARDKLVDMVVSYINCVLGVEINTRRLTYRVPCNYISTTTLLLEQKWHEKRKSFTILEIEVLTGRLGHIATSAKWLAFLMSQVYTSVAKALQAEQAHLICTSKDFRRLLKEFKHGRATTNAGDTHGNAAAAQHRCATYAQSRATSMVHQSSSKHFISKSLRRELSLSLSHLSGPHRFVDLF